MKALLKLAMVVFIIALTYQYVKNEQPNFYNDSKQILLVAKKNGEALLNSIKDLVQDYEKEHEKKETIQIDTVKEVTTLESEYGVDWVVSHDQYRQFTLKLKNDEGGYVTGKGRKVLGVVIGETTNQMIQKKYGEPLKGMLQNRSFYQFSDKDAQKQLVYKRNGYYIWYFIDEFNDDKVRAVQYISIDQENKKQSYYTKKSKKLRHSYEKMMVLLMNQSRVEAGLKPLIYDEGLTEATRMHSKDMIRNHYFDHVNLRGEQPQDRMKAAGYTNEKLYAENLAYGQVSAIFAHEGLMNSEGHRENILRKEATHVGVGVGFDEENTPYYTINFYTPF